MDTKQLLLKKVPAAMLVVVVATLGVAVPALDQDFFGATASFESEHNPSTCLTGHDHTVCTQIGAGRWLPSSSADVEMGPRQVAVVAVDATGLAAHRTSTRVLHSRAPPLV